MDLSARRKRRGVPSGSLAKLRTKVDGWTTKGPLSAIELLSVEQAKARLHTLDTEFKRYHMEVIDALEEEDELEREQAVMDDHESRVAHISISLKALSVPTKESIVKVDDKEQNLFRRRLAHLEKNLRKVNAQIEHLDPGPGIDRFLLEQYKDQFDGFKLELLDISRGITAIEEATDLPEKESEISDAIFNVGLKIRKLLSTPTEPPTTPSREGIKLPKIAVPTFDRDVLKWMNFWEQFEISVHGKDRLTDAEKMAYLRDALKGGPAEQVIQGLAQTAETYKEAISCLRSRYDRPRLIHQAHVRAILDLAPLKDGNGKEVRKLHDVINQNARALKAMKQASFDSMLTAIAEAKMDNNTMREWRKYSRDQKETPPYTEIVEFLDLHARDTEDIIRDDVRKRPMSIPERRIAKTYTTNVNDNCVACKVGKHPLYACKAYQSFPHSKKLMIAKENKLCLNCLRPGHFVKQCTSTQRCKKCLGLHHSCLHIERAAGSPSTGQSSPSSPMEKDKVVSTHTAQLSSSRQVLLMTCQVIAIGHDNSTYRARALLDPASSVSFVSERLAQHLRLSRRHHSSLISGIGGETMRTTSHGSVDLHVKSTHTNGRLLKLEALVLPKITSNLPSSRVTFDTRWKHLSGLELADPEFGTPGCIDMLLGVDIFNRTVLYGRRYGPSGTPSAFKTSFGWVLSGSIRNTKYSQRSDNCFFTTLSPEDILRRFWEVEDHNYHQPVLSSEEQAVIQHFEKTQPRRVWTIHRTTPNQARHDSIRRIEIFCCEKVRNS